MLYFPSENAPAPAIPSMIEQGLHLIHFFIFPAKIGQDLSSKDFPLSNIKTDNSD